MAILLDPISDQEKTQRILAQAPTNGIAILQGLLDSQDEKFILPCLRVLVQIPSTAKPTLLKALRSTFIRTLGALGHLDTSGSAEILATVSSLEEEVRSGQRKWKGPWRETRDAVDRQKVLNVCIFTRVELGDQQALKTYESILRDKDRPERTAMMLHLRRFRPTRAIVALAARLLEDDSLFAEARTTGWIRRPMTRVCDMAEGALRGWFKDEIPPRKTRSPSARETGSSDEEIQAMREFVRKKLDSM